MTPIEIAKSLYKDHVEHPSFEEALGGYLSSNNGAIVSTPTLFAMGAALDYDGKHAWYIDTAVGDLKELVKTLPFRLPYIAFSRGKRTAKLKIYRMERFLRLVK